MRSRISTNKKAFTLTELMVASGLGALAITGFLRFQSNITRRNLENTARSAAQSELDGFALQLRKDFERHASSLANSLQALPAAVPFIAPTNGTQTCQNLTILQTILGTGAGTNTNNKIQYQTQCNGEAFPSDFKPNFLHPELTTSSCALGPKVSRTYWQNSTSTGAGTVSNYPGPGVRALAMCMRPNAAANPTQYGAEISVAYQSADGSWKVLQKTLNLVANEFGTSGIEILPPQ